MPALRILHVVPYYEHAWAYGGIPRLAAAMTDGLARRGHDVTVCTTDACDATTRVRGPRAAHTASGVRVHVFPNLSNRLAYHWQLFAPIGLAAHLRAHARSFDIAHLHACRNLPGAIAARALRRCGVPYVISPNGTAPAIERRIVAKRVFDRTIGTAPLTRSARVVASSAAEERQLQDLGIPRDRISVVPNPIDDAEFERGADPARFRAAHGLGGAPLVLYLGKLTPRKGLDVLLDAFHRLPRPEAILAIAGNDMGSGAMVDATIAALGLGARARRIGLLAGSSRLDALAAADVVVYPSQHEVFGLVAVEALMCGTPVVVCDDSGCGEIVTQAGGGLAVPYGDSRRLAEAIASVLAAPREWRARARDGAAFVRARFSAAAVCRRLEDVYRDVLDESRSAA